MAEEKGEGTEQSLLCHLASHYRREKRRGIPEPPQAYDKIGKTLVAVRFDPAQQMVLAMRRSAERRIVQET